MDLSRPSASSPIYYICAGQRLAYGDEDNEYDDSPTAYVAYAKLTTENITYVQEDDEEALNATEAIL